VTRASKTDPYPFSMTIGAQIRETKERRQLSDKRFAKTAGISRRHLVEIQKGANVSLLVAFKAMAALGLTELTHEFDGQTLSLSVTYTPAALDVATRLEAAEKLESAIAALTACVALLRPPGVAAEAPPAGAKGSRSARGTALVDDFLGRLHDLDPATQVDVLQKLAKAAVTPQQPTATVASEHPAPARKRRTKTR
jgi:transcriptional regulator with XRE-family HTH domain